MKKISTRLNRAVLSVTVTIFLIIIFCFYWFTQGIISQHSFRMADNALTMTNVHIQNVLKSVETSVRLAAFQVQDDLNEADHLFDPAVLVELNPTINRCLITFRPGYYPGKGAIYSSQAFRSGDSIISERSPEANHHWNTDLYRMLENTRQGRWSDLYSDSSEEMEKVLMMTYTQPVFNEDSLACVISANISLEWLMELINENNPFPNSTTVLLSENEDLAIYNVKEKALEIYSRDDLEEKLEQVIDTRWSVNENLQSGNHEMVLTFVNGILYFGFYYYLPALDMLVSIAAPHEDLFGDLIPISIIVFVVIIGGLLLLYVVITRRINRIIRPLTEFTGSARNIAQGDFTSALPKITSGDEMQQLSESFEDMQSSLVRYIDELRKTTTAKERIESELVIARAIQMAMIPKKFPPFPDRDDVDVYAVMQPAKEVGGDLYDFFIKDDKLYFIVGDVSGKGIPASLLMAVTKSIFRSAAYQVDEPSRIIEQINVAIEGTNDADMFVTLFVGILNLKNGQMDYCNAGHNPAILLNAQSAAFIETTPNLPGGVYTDYAYTPQQLHLEKETTLVLYTDGLTEAMNARKEFYGNNRLFVLSGTLIKETPQTVTTTLMEDVSHFIGPSEQNDDLTILVVSFRG